MCSCSTSGILNGLLQAQRSQVETQVGVAVIAKSLDAVQVQGDAAVELLQTATEIARQLGKGLEFDARA